MSRKASRKRIAACLGSTFAITAVYAIARGVSSGANDRVMQKAHACVMHELQTPEGSYFSGATRIENSGPKSYNVTGMVAGQDGDGKHEEYAFRVEVTEPANGGSGGMSCGRVTIGK